MCTNYTAYDENTVLEFMAGSAMIFSGFAIVANDLREGVSRLTSEVDGLVENTIVWSPLIMVAEQKELTKDAVRKQLQNGNFEEGVDFKYDGNKIIVHQGAIGRIRRQRRSNNG